MELADRQWVPEGENKHSQSVVDLFEFIRDAAKVVLHDLPLSEYKRAVYLIDLSKVSPEADQSANAEAADCISRDLSVRFDGVGSFRSGYQSYQSWNSWR